MNKFFQTFHKHDLQLRTVDELSDKTLCEYSGSYAHLECLERRCKSCLADKIMDHYVEVLGDINIEKKTVSWTKWTTVERMKFDKRIGKETKRHYNEVTRVVSTLEELLQAAVDDLKTFPMHIFKTK